MLKYRTKDEQRALCEAWRQSRLTQTEFCRQNNLKFNTLNRWLRNIKSTLDSSGTNSSNIASDTQDIKFFPVSGSSINPNNSNHNKNLLEVILPSGASFRAYLSESNINAFLRESLR